MNKCKSLPYNIDIVAQLADMKEIDYKNLLTLTALIELLVEKQVFTHEEIAQKVNKIDVINDLPQNTSNEL